MMQIIGTREAAEILHCSRSTVTRLATAGKLPFLKKLPGRLGNYLFDRSQIEALAASNGIAGVAA